MINTLSLDPAAVSTGATLSNKRDLFAEIATRAAACYGLDSGAVLEAIEEREALGSTGFGGGVAIPHAKLSGLAAPVGLCFRLARPIAFEALDDQPVDIVFCLLSPVDSGAVHLKALAEVSRLVRDQAVVAKLRGAAGDAAFYALLSRAEERDAA